MAQNPYESPKEVDGVLVHTVVDVFDGGIVSIEYTQEEFEAAKKMLLSDLLPPGTSIEDVKAIHLSGPREPRSGSSYRRDRLALVGCAVVAFVLLFLAVLGIIAIIEGLPR